jgi:hypothetical protein
MPNEKVDILKENNISTRSVGDDQLFLGFSVFSFKS